MGIKKYKNTMGKIEITNPHGTKIIFHPTNAVCPICGKFVCMSWESNEWYCNNCSMIFWYESQSDKSKQKRIDKLTNILINSSIQQYILVNKKKSIFLTTRFIIQQVCSRLYRKTRHLINRFLRRKELLTEACQFSVPNSKYTLHIDYRERNHKIPHFHFYYGGGKNPPRSRAYRIDNFRPIGKENDKHFKKNPKAFQNFLELSKKWHSTKDKDGKTGQEKLQIVWNIAKDIK